MAQLNIKDVETIRKVRAIAEARGEALTQTIRALVNQEWDRREAARSDRTTQRLRAVRVIQDEVRCLTPPETIKMTSKEIIDSIYDDDQPDGHAL